MRVIITGGTGLIGRALAEDLARDGYEVVVLSRSPERFTPYEEPREGRWRPPPGVRVAYWDGRTAGDWAHLVDSADAVVNLAGENLAGSGFFPSRWTARRKHRIRQSRLDAGQAIVEAVDLAAHKPGLVVQASGIGYYGPCGEEEIDEKAPPGDDFLGQVAVQWEDSTAAVEAMGVRRAIIRSGGVLTPRGGVLPRILLPVRLYVGGPVGGGRQWVPWIHLRDEVRAIRFLIENGQAHGPFNLVSPEAVNNREFVKTLARVIKRPAFLPIPPFVLRLAFGEMATLLLDGQRGVPKRLLELGFAFEFPKLRPALQDLLSGEAE